MNQRPSVITDMHTAARSPMRPVRLALCVLLATGSAWAGGPVSRIDTIEHIFGASNINAVAGHGGVTAGISRDGEVTMLSWPSPSCCDQLLYVASNALNVRDLPRYGALDGMGITAGIAVDTPTSQQTYWLNDGTWQIDQHYLDDQSLVPVTHFRNDTLDLDVTVTDSVDPDRDVLQRHFQLVRGPLAAQGTYALITFANLSPTVSELAELPVADWALDVRNDFGAVWDETSGAVLQFHPADRGTVRLLSDALNPATVDYGSFDQVLAATGNDAATAAGLVQRLDTEFGPGAYASITTVPRPVEHQVGFDSTALCAAMASLTDNVLALPNFGIQLPLPTEAIQAIRCTDPLPTLRTSHGWNHVAPDAREDAATGHLSGSHFAAGQVDVALRTLLTNDEASVRIAFGPTAAASLASLGAATTPADLQARDVAAWHAYSAGIAVPVAVSAAPVGTSPDQVTRTARRALLHDVAGTARATGAIVASIARQAPYGLDWPRDGAFFDYAFDVAGDTTRVTRRLEWAAPLARTMALYHGTALIDAMPPIDPTNGQRRYPANAWEMDYYADGTNAGNIRFEIDNTAFMVWSMAVHLAYLDEPERRRVALELYPALSAGADLVAGWRDATTGLNALASEDDTVTFTSSLHGAVAVYAGLTAGARAARYLGHYDAARRWDARAVELRGAILNQLYDPTTMRFRTVQSSDGLINVGSVNNGDTAWLVWPAELLPFDDPRLAAQLRADLEATLAILRGAGEGGQYLGKNLLAGAVAVTHGADPTLRPLVEEGIARLAVAVPSANTQVYGEVYVNRGTPTAPVFECRTSNPHLWEGTLVYLAAMALEHPERFDLDQSLPAGPDISGADAGVDAAVADVAMDGSQIVHMTPHGCGCRVESIGESRGGGTALLLVSALAMWISVRRRGLAQRGDSRGASRAS